MWLKTLSKRTPSAYFVYTIVVVILLLIPQVKTIFQFFTNRDIYLQQIPPFYIEFEFVLIPIAAFLLSLLVNRVFITTDTFNRNTLWPGYLYALLLLAIMHQYTLIDMITHGVIGIFITSELLRVQYNKQAKFESYNIGFLLGVAMLLESSILMFVPIVLYALLNLKPLSFRETILYFLGISTPIYFLLSYCFLIDDFSIWATIIITIYEWFGFNNSIATGSILLWSIVIAAFVILSFLVFLNYNSLQVYLRRLSSALMILIVGALIIGVANLFRGYLIFYIAPTFAFMSTMLMLRYPNKRIVPIIHFIFVVTIISLQLVNNYLL